MLKETDSRIPQIIYNTAGGALQTTNAIDFTRYGNLLSDIGLEGVSALPFRTENIVELYQEYFPPVVLIEDAWNPGHFDNLGLAITEGIWGHLKRALGDETEPSILQDTMLFPAKATSTLLTNELMEAYPNAHFGATDFDSGFPVERTYVHLQREYQSHQMDANEILEKSHKSGSLLLYDPTHLLSPDRISLRGSPTKPLATEWERQLVKFSSRIAGIDIHASTPTEMDELLHRSGKLYELTHAGFELCQKLEFMRLEAQVPLKSQLPFAPMTDRAKLYLTSLTDMLIKVRSVYHRPTT
jgi:hypothetical protein